MAATEGDPDAERAGGSSPRPALARAVGLTATCTLIVFLVGAIDYATGFEARVFPLYYLPIALGALRVSRAVGLGLAALSTALWAAAMWLAGAGWSPALFIFNSATQASSFALIAILVANLTRRVKVEHQLSRSDPLTPLPNSRAFYEIAEVLLAGARRSGRPFTLAYLDLDNFKLVNDRYGHLEGDLALKAVAEVLRKATRASDLAARLGGDEFGILLPDTGPEAARPVLERIRDLLAEELEERRWPITASIGAMAYLRAPATIEIAVQAADALMYRAKQGGKNRVLLETFGAEDAPREELRESAQRKELGAPGR